MKKVQVSGKIDSPMMPCSFHGNRLFTLKTFARQLQVPAQFSKRACGIAVPREINPFLHRYNEIVRKKLLSSQLSFPRAKSMKALEFQDITVRLINPEDKVAVTKFMRRTFFKEEPVMQSMGLNGCLSPALEDYMLKPLSAGLSLMALHGDQKDIVGVSINALVKKDEPVIPDKEELLKRIDKREVPYVEFDDFVYTKADLFRHCNVPCMIELRYLGVDKFLRAGLARLLAGKTVEMTRNCGYSILMAMCTSLYGFRIAASFGMTEVWCMSYNEFTDKNGKALFKPAEPQTAVRVMVLNLAKMKPSGEKNSADLQ